MRPQKSDPPKICEFCGDAFARKRFGNRLEDRNAFLKRKYCSLSCANSKKGELTKHGYSWRARKHIKTYCEACGYSRALHAHHIDQDITNNREENIQTLCKHCHDYWHTTQKRMRRKIAGKMPRLY